MGGIRRMCGRGRHSVRILHGDGQILHVFPPVTVADILRKYPHHFVCHMNPDVSSNSTMLPLELELEPEYAYFLLPIPRLFPCSPSTAASLSCSCFDKDDNNCQLRVHIKESLPFSPKLKKFVSSLGSPLRSPGHGRKISPEVRSPSNSCTPYSNPYITLSPAASPRTSPRSKKRCGSPVRSRDRNQPKQGVVQYNWCKWKPKLGKIMENDALSTHNDELAMGMEISCSRDMDWGSTHRRKQSFGAMTGMDSAAHGGGSWIMI